MTEAEWQAAGEPTPMLDFLSRTPARRKLRLFACACCDRIDNLITDPRSRAALEFASRHVDTAVNRQKGRTAIEKAGEAAHREYYNDVFNYTDERSAACLVRSCAADAAVQTMNTNPTHAARYASSFACFAVAWGAVQAAKKSARNNDLSAELKAPEFAQQVRLLRDVFGNPFRPVVFDPAWLTSTVVAVARGIYDDRAFDRLPILADALQDAGCEDGDVLGHCRGDGPHVRGCWVVDLVLGKE